MKKVLKVVLGDPQAQAIKKYKKIVSHINKLEPKYQALTDEQLRGKTAEFKKLTLKKSLDDLLPEVFALVREASFRVLKQRHFDVQLIGGMVLHFGNVAEMKTGEGKTLVATLPTVLNSLTGKGVHVVTVNEYLSRRDAGWMAQVYHFLGLSTAVIIPDASYIFDPEYTDDSHTDPRFRHLKPCTRVEAYGADITYATNNELGFDYLRDNMVSDIQDLRQRELNFAVVDEVDSILIDEARTPLIISAPASQSDAGYMLFADIAKQLTPEDYILEEKRHAVNLTSKGIRKIATILNVESLYTPENVRYIYHIEQALKAETLFKRDKDYVVASDGEVIIVDAFTGRLLKGRRYNEGLHQAIEAKEGVKIQEESMTLATTSFQNYFRLYNKLSGMTGTAKTEEEEFQKVYKMDVIQVPTNRKISRKDLPDRIYAGELAKFKAIINKIKELQITGQPVLIGTVAIEKNELLSKMLDREGISHKVLNAKNNEGEAEIVAHAGQIGSVTLATNIAGRGTDIVLGEGVKDLGGLFVLGSERHESRRIDNQLRGRCGRQGDPGTTQFYVSAQDDLMRIFGGDRMSSIMEKLGSNAETPVENRAISKAVESAQKKIEGMNFDQRKNVVQYDDVMNRHRKAIYSARKSMLHATDSGTISKQISALAQNQATISATTLTGSAVEDIALATQDLTLAATQFNLHPDRVDEIRKILKLPDASEPTLIKVKKSNPRIKIKFLKRFRAKSKTTPDIKVEKPIKGKLKSKNIKKVSAQVQKILQTSFQSQLDKTTQNSDPESVSNVSRAIYLQLLDSLWMQHLENMGHLREGIGWRSIAQKDPLVEYRFEGQRIFEDMNSTLQSELVTAVSHVNPKIVAKHIETELTRAAQKSQADLAPNLSATEEKKLFLAEDASIEIPLEGLGLEDARDPNAPVATIKTKKNPNGGSKAKPTKSQIQARRKKNEIIKKGNNCMPKNIQVTIIYSRNQCP